MFSYLISWNIKQDIFVPEIWDIHANGYDNIEEWSSITNQKRSNLLIGFAEASYHGKIIKNKENRICNPQKDTDCNCGIIFSTVCFIEQSNIQCPYERKFTYELGNRK